MLPMVLLEQVFLIMFSRDQMNILQVSLSEEMGGKEIARISKEERRGEAEIEWGIENKRKLEEWPTKNIPFYLICAQFLSNNMILKPYNVYYKYCWKMNVSINKELVKLDVFLIVS